MQIEYGDDGISVIYYRVLDKMTKSFEYDNLQELAKDLIVPS